MSNSPQSGASNKSSNDDILDALTVQGGAVEARLCHSHQKKLITELAALWPVEL